MTTTAATNPSSHALRIAFALSMGTAVSLGITRFSYGLLLPPMRADLRWSYALAGGMNTANAAGYLLGAIMTPALIRLVGPVRMLVGGAVLASLFMAASGFFIDAPMLLAQRFLAGLASAWVFVAGSLLAARLGALHPSRAGLVLGVYYGGTGFGIVLSALLVPPVLVAAAAEPHAWAWAWWALALAAFAASGILMLAVRAMPRGTQPAGAMTASSATAAARTPARVHQFGWALCAYTLFGAGYIGYMTFVIALLREQGAAPGDITWFYALLGVACVLSSRLWAGLLDRFHGGQPQAMLNALLGVATLLPVLSAAWPVTLASGLLFGSVFLSVVASTTALVRHNLPVDRWAAGISAFTIAFALGQIVGPTVTGWISDGKGGLARGLVVSAITLWAAALLASRQRPVGVAPMQQADREFRGS